MSLEPGATLGKYEVLSAPGARAWEKCIGRGLPKLERELPIKPTTVRCRPGRSGALERPSAARRLLGSGIELQPETVCEPREVVEDTDNVGELEATLVVESEVTQRLPVLFDHPCWR